MKKIFTFFIPCFAFVLAGNSGAYSQATHLKALNDTVDLIPGIPTTINLLANDSIPPGDSITVMGGGATCPGGTITKSGSMGLFTYTANWGYNGECTGSYVLWNRKDTAAMDTSHAKILFRIHDRSYDSLDLNNVNARFNASGINFLSPNIAGFEVPKNSGKHTIYMNGLWIGGLSADSLLHSAVYGYTSFPGSFSDFYAGPVMDSSAYSIFQDTIWNRVWKLKRSDIAYHLAHFSDPGYHPMDEIATWPGNGNTAIGEAPLLAPFFDVNGNHLYEPLLGDYPLIRGDEATFFIFNDDRKLHGNNGNKMRMEVHAMAYVFDLPGDSAFYNTVFLNYKIYNRSQQTYYKTYTGLFTDFDIGFYADDYTGCDVQRSSCIGYNGDPVDGTGQPGQYGVHPPAQSVTILAGPRLDPDGIDNPKKDATGHQLCNASVDGMNFGDSIVDNERYGMTNFVMYLDPNNNPGFQFTDIPKYDYNFMKSIFLDSIKLSYGGGGTSWNGAYGPFCNFMFPGLTDTLNWGVGCVAPNGPENWTEGIAGFPPTEIKGVSSMGPFTFNPGDMQEIDLAFVFARDYIGSDSMPSVTKLGQMIDIIRNAWFINKLPNGETFNEGIQPPPSTTTGINLYPNPAIKKVTLDFGQPVNEPVHITILTTNGEIVSSKIVNPHSTLLGLDVSTISSGFYLVRIQIGQEIQTKKIVLIR